MDTYFSRAWHSPIPRYSALLLVALALISLAGCSTTSAIDGACRHGDLIKVRALLKDQPGLVFSKDRFDSTPLAHAVAFDHKDVAELLLAQGADVNAKDSDGWTPLHCAANIGLKDMAELLLAHGADVNAVTITLYLNGVATGGATPLYLARLRKHMDVAELLRQHGGVDRGNGVHQLSR